MCFIRSLKVKEIKNKTVILENGIEAYYEEGEVGEIKPNEKVLVFGNLVIEKIKNARDERKK